MHPNPIYRTADAQKNLAFARRRAFGVLAVADVGAGAPLVSHVPFLLSEDGTQAELHLVRSNPISRLLDTPVAARLAVTGSDSYVSPDWYGLEDQVPTWNYVAVHLTGMLEPMPHDSLHDLLERQSAFFENLLLPKTPWRMEKLTEQTRDRLMRAIIPCRLRVESVDGTWKLAQNKPDAARLQAADGVENSGMGVDMAVLADLMRRAGE